MKSRLKVHKLVGHGIQAIVCGRGCVCSNCRKANQSVLFNYQWSKVTCKSCLWAKDKNFTK